MNEAAELLDEETEAAQEDEVRRCPRVLIYSEEDDVPSEETVTIAKIEEVVTEADIQDMWFSFIKEDDAFLEWEVAVALVKIESKELETTDAGVGLESALAVEANSSGINLELEATAREGPQVRMARMTMR